MKPNCYKCQFRGRVAGSTHSSCHIPQLKELHADPGWKIISLMSRGQNLGLHVGTGVVGNPHGMKKGWFNWPINFDPAWLEECPFYKEKENK